MLDEPTCKHYLCELLIIIFLISIPCSIAFSSGASLITNTYVHDSREGTIACDNAQSVIHKKQVYCLTIVDTN